MEFEPSPHIEPASPVCWYIPLKTGITRWACYRSWMLSEMSVFCGGSISPETARYGRSRSTHQGKLTLWCAGIAPVLIANTPLEYIIQMNQWGHFRSHINTYNRSILTRSVLKIDIKN